mmetsp:Transcript_27713/g.76302  ORF Transcript_27713/g.76302 Transcript_27713/m.76302 type:complete len:349 (-) Transcript_27713:12-1058(-)|eukprot:CAMPEP_0179102024 /NCGR_PEP_ID=MMETSP0796-20121207/47201_1 /TAXON_ID=73915 /ORGANISM="Pyrodinium bahamense, Strain pbaha01" /LENGTH=348 /DNA_ID=CAMNT_0020799891 /DNA_START=125 /DNA_END=1171 /DNA_ORIENTATION=+
MKSGGWAKGGSQFHFASPGSADWKGTPCGKGGGQETFVGTVKIYNQEKGWGMIACDRIQRMHQKDAFFLKSSVPGGVINTGQRVRFYVRIESKGPVAVDIQPVDWSAGGGGCGYGYPGSYGGPFGGMGQVVGFGPWGPMGAMGQFAGPMAPWAPMGDPMMGTQQMQRGPLGSQTYFGSVASFNEEKGWGFISCDATRRIFNKDVFLIRGVLKGQTVNAGDLVSFKVTMGLKGPQATEVSLPPPGSISADGVPGKIFYGTIKNFIATKGFGFIEGEAVRTAFGKDIFVHKREFGGEMPNSGDEVEFSVELDNNGQPQAKNVVARAAHNSEVGAEPGEAAEIAAPSVDDP